MPEGIQELRTADGRYIYFAWIGGQWTDLAPWGNRLP